MSIQTCDLPRQSRLSALWSLLTRRHPDCAAPSLPSRLWPDGAMPNHPCASRVARELAWELRDVPESLRRDLGLDGGVKLQHFDLRWLIR